MSLTHADADLRACRRSVMVHEWFRRRDGCGPWVVRAGNPGGGDGPRIIGWGGLYQDPFDPGWGFEVGYYFHPAGWGKGYASKLVACALRVADDVLSLPEVWAMAHPTNAASRRVLEKAGFTVERTLPERERLLFRREGPGEGAGEAPGGERGPHCHGIDRRGPGVAPAPTMRGRRC